MKVLSIDIDKIEQNENSRVVYKEADLSELMSSMKEDGLLQPIGVRVIGGGRYDCVFGNRRLVAAKKLGWVKIDASLLERTEEKERDILNLVENLKRQNTTVAEDGRMFCKLLEYGLTKNEVAARLGITTLRVETAIDVFKEFPKELQKIIVNSHSGVRNRAGRISASMAVQINNVRKTNSLNREQTRTLIHYAKQDGVSPQQVNNIAPLMRTGMKLQKAIETVEKLQTLVLQVMISHSDIAKLEKKHGETIHDILYDKLESNFPIERIGSKSAGMGARKKEPHA